jgi:DNA-binding CsgD family transcriptional regulator
MAELVRSIGCGDLLHGVRVLLLERSEWTTRASWLMDAGATITRACTLHGVDVLSEQHDVAVIDTALYDAREVLKCLTPGCGIVLLAEGASTAAAELADRAQAAIVLQDAPRADFLFEIRRSAQLQVPSIEYLVARAERLWKLSAQQARVLSHNLLSHSNLEIARAIGISVHTVQEHQDGLRRRTGVSTKHGYLRCLAEMAGMRPPLDDEGAHD